MVSQGRADAASLEPDILVNKADKVLNAVQNRLNFHLHRWSSGLTVATRFDTDCITEDQPFFQFPAPSQRPPRGLSSTCGPGDRALQECNPSTGSSMDCSDCIPPGSGQFPDRVFAVCDASANHGQSEKLILPLGPQAAIFPIDYPRILLQTPFLSGTGKSAFVRAKCKLVFWEQTGSDGQGGLADCVTTREFRLGTVIHVVPTPL